MNDCTNTQESVALGVHLSDSQRQHLGACPSCAAVAAQWSVLDSLCAGEATAEVPAGFADAVMARVEAEGPGPRGWLDRRWVQVGLANLAALVTLANLVRFVARLLVPVTSLGGAP